MFTSPWFWMWAMDHHNNQPVIVNGGGQPQYSQQAPQQYAPQPAPALNILGFVLSIVFQLAVLGGIGWAIWWAVKKFVLKK